MGLYAEYSFIDDGGFPDEISGGDDQIGEASVSVDYSSACAVFVDTFLRVANQLVPVDTGYLRSTIDAGEWGDGFWCEATADYAQYVEYGTSYMDAQPYFEPALEAAFGEAMIEA
jgi:HK97 gp10 family phage protein